MLRTVLVAVLFCTSASIDTVHGRGTARKHGRIVGGSDAIIDDYPWQASLQYLGYHVCGATIIDASRVLTAAHCVQGLFANFLSVRSGTTTLNSGGDVHDVTTGIYHGLFDPETFDYDIAILQVASRFNNEEIVGLPDNNATALEDPLPGTLVTVTGWGSGEPDGNLSTTLQVVNTTIIDRDECRSLFLDNGMNNVTERMICAGTASTSDAGVVCTGDYGGPLVDNRTLLGIASWSAAECENYPSVFTSIVYFRDWIANALIY